MASPSTLDTPVHLVVLNHGLWGEPKHLHTLAMMLCRSLGKRASISKGTGGKKSKQQQIGPGDADSSTLSSSRTSQDDSDDSDDVLDEQDAKLEQYIQEYIKERKEEDQDMDILILNSMSNKGSKTYDGIDWIAERVVREIKAEEVELRKQSKYVARFSIIGYSLGGLVARYVIALLDSQEYFKPAKQGGRTVEARHFATFATPHIGVPPADGNFGRLANFIGGRMLSRTGEQLYLLDSGWESEKNELHHHNASSPSSSSSSSSSKKVKVGLIESMAKPDSIFISALNRFQKITIYANAVNDRTVPFRTGCIEEWDPFYELKGKLDVSLVEGTHLLSTVEPAEPVQLTTWQKICAMAPSLPFFMNPRRLPMRYPYNYLVVLGLPILFPTMVVLIIYKFSTESRKSRARVLELDRGWSVEEGKGKDERGRIDQLIRSVVMSSTEDRVEEGRSLLPTTPNEETSPAHIKSNTTNIAQLPLPSKRSPLQDLTLTKKRKQAPLKESQKKMVRTLNDPNIVPRLEKRWAYFDEVTNSHAVIVCRVPQIEVHRQGLSVLQHFVNDMHA